MIYNRETKLINLMLVVFATLAFALFVLVPQALWIPALWFAGHLCVGIYRAFIKPGLSYLRTYQPVRI